MWQWLMSLEAEKFDLGEKLKRQKYDVSLLSALKKNKLNKIAANLLAPSAGQIRYACP